MKIPAQTKPTFWGAVLGGIVTMIIGFGWGGWSIASTAERNANLRAEKAVVAALSPICVSNFNQQSDMTSAMAELKKVSGWQQGDYIAKGGWATMAGSKAPDASVAKACAETLGLPKS